MIIWRVLMISDEKNRSKEAAKNFSEMTRKEQVEELKKRDLDLKKEMREVIETEEKAWYRNAIRENSLLISSLS